MTVVWSVRAVVVLVAAVIAAASGGGGAGAGATVAVQQPPLVAAAANLQPVLAAIAEGFARDGHGRVELVFGASGALARQILEGAPFELFLSADEEFPARIVEAGLARDRGIVYANGRLALFAPRESPLQVDVVLEGLSRFAASGTPGKFAIANPDVAPYGRAAEAVLRRHGLWDVLRPRLVLADTISQAAQFAASGNAVGGLIAYSIARDPRVARRGVFALVPERDHPPLRQRMVRLKSAGAVAGAFYEYLQGTAARKLFVEHGYGLPE